MEKHHHTKAQEGKERFKKIQGEKMGKREQMENDYYLETQKGKDR
jgi:hypothetical protein